MSEVPHSLRARTRLCGTGMSSIGCDTSVRSDIPPLETPPQALKSVSPLHGLLAAFVLPVASTMSPR